MTAAKLQLAPLATSILKGDGRLDNTAITVRLVGTADTQSRPALETYVNQLHTEAVRIGVTKVVVDLRELEFMNSSCFKIFVAWLAQLRDLPADKQYRMHMHSNPKLLWQRRSLAALSCFAVDLVAIET